MILSGATDKGDSKYKIESKGGIGWYCDAGMDGSKVQGINVEFGAATTNSLYMQVFYGDNQVLRKKFWPISPLTSSTLVRMLNTVM